MISVPLRTGTIANQKRVLVSWSLVAVEAKHSSSIVGSALFGSASIIYLLISAQPMVTHGHARWLVTMFQVRSRLNFKRENEASIAEACNRQRDRHQWLEGFFSLCSSYLSGIGAVQ